MWGVYKNQINFMVLLDQKFSCFISVEGIYLFNLIKGNYFIFNA